MIETLDDKVQMQVPAGTPSDKIFRLRGKGISRLHDYGRGDQLVKVQIDVPASLSQEQKRALKEFARVSGEDSGPLSKSFLEKMRRMFK